MRVPVAMFVTHAEPHGESFLLRELEAMERQGQPVMLVRARPMLSGAIVRALWRRPAAVLQLLGWIVAGTWLRPTMLAKSLLVVPLAAELAEKLPRIGIGHVHAHVATHAATLAAMVSKLAGIPYSFTAHTHAIFVDRVLLREKIRDAAFVRTTTEFNRRFLESLYPAECAGQPVSSRAQSRDRPIALDPAASAGDAAPSSRRGTTPGSGKVRVVRVGACRDAVPADEDRRAEARPTVVCVAAEKPHKGLAVLREACEELDVDCVITEERREIARADVYVQPSVIAPNGQMDGMPVALIDAMAAGKPVIASAIGGIPELVVHDQSGLLVDPANPRMLAAAITRVLRNPALRAKLARCAREKVAREFCLERCTAQLIRMFAS